MCGCGGESVVVEEAVLDASSMICGRSGAAGLGGWMESDDMDDRSDMADKCRVGGGRRRVRHEGAQAASNAARAQLITALLKRRHSRCH